MSEQRYSSWSRMLLWAQWITNRVLRAERAGASPSLFDVVTPVLCAGCDTGGERLCAQCQRALREPPGRVFPRLDPEVPVWACGSYGGAHRAVILAMKERGRHDMAAYVGAVVAAAIEFLAARGELPEPGELVAIPAPSRRKTQRRRGGDPVTAVCRAAGLDTWPVVWLENTARDSVGLSLEARVDNVRSHLQVARVVPRGCRVLLVDDVITTGATAKETVALLRSAGVQVGGVLVVAAAL